MIFSCCKNYLPKWENFDTLFDSLILYLGFWKLNKKLWAKHIWRGKWFSKIQTLTNLQTNEIRDQGSYPNADSSTSIPYNTTVKANKLCKNIIGTCYIQTLMTKTGYYTLAFHHNIIIISNIAIFIIVTFVVAAEILILINIKMTIIIITLITFISITIIIIISNSSKNTSKNTNNQYCFITFKSTALRKKWKHPKMDTTVVRSNYDFKYSWEINAATHFSLLWYRDIRCYKKWYENNQRFNNINTWAYKR